MRCPTVSEAQVDRRNRQHGHRRRQHDVRYQKRKIGVSNCDRRIAGKLLATLNHHVVGHVTYLAGTASAVEAAGYTIAVTTEMALLGSAPASRLELPRLDAFYLRRPGVLERWGTESFRRFVWFRAGAGRVRSVLARTGLPL